jgi:hypothetical protein
MEKKISQLSLDRLQAIVGGISYATATVSAPVYAAPSTSLSGVKVPVWSVPVVR